MKFLLMLAQLDPVSSLLSFVERFGLAAVVILIFFKWVIPKLDKVCENVGALTYVLGKKFDISADELKKAKMELMKEKLFK